MGRFGRSEDGAKEAVPPPPAALVHTLIADRYRVIEPIGEGGMAEVWRAEDTRLARPVAVKLLTLVMESESAERSVHRFLREARLAASVRHPNVVDVLDFGTTDTGRPFMVMELLAGESLESRLTRTPPVTLSELVQFIVAILDGLDAVHRAGIVHRDMKPDNVFLLDDGEGGVRPKLLDFGVSRAARTEEGRRSVLTTMEGRLVGTPEYMSPEQARGRRDIDVRADLYSVGVILYEAMTGQLPYEAEGLGDLIIAIASGGAPSARELRPEVGEALSDAIAKAMSLKREDRYASAREMKNALLEATSAAVGRPMRDSLPAMALARHSVATSGAVTIPPPPATIPPVRAANPTPHTWTLSEKPRPVRRRWPIAAGIGAVLVAGLASYAIVALTVAPVEEPEPLAVPVAHMPAQDPPADLGGAPPIASPSSMQPAVALEATSLEAAEPDGARVRVQLDGVPARARVTIDGEPAPLEGGAILMPRDGEQHWIAVRSDSGVWSIRHRADHGASYRVQLRRGNAAPEASPAADREGVFRELDY